MTHNSSIKSIKVFRNRISMFMLQESTRLHSTTTKSGVVVMRDNLIVFNDQFNNDDYFNNSISLSFATTNNHTNLQLGVCCMTIPICIISPVLLLNVSAFMSSALFSPSFILFVRPGQCTACQCDYSVAQ